MSKPAPVWLAGISREEGQHMSIDETAPPGNASASALMPIANIKIGTRHRKDLGDIDGLAASIQQVGLLHPLVVTPGLTLLAGERRLAASSAHHQAATGLRNGAAEAERG